ncbi:histidine phosphatase family protein [Flavobacterium sp. CYK-4]|uniref:SixA phosphatase family protein n=1 Tax=Flavobacterium lotistagni TaxID=2709660 RepID=UPI00140920E6|nr:histidine phosphatase family protein [Flavobacterium lotistagni]NHM07486.1 histidine phosphatase family protein [Flavobacterium lotistagni]
MKNLILIRHAKSSWDSPTADIDRALESRGIKDAKLVAQHSLSFIPKAYKIFSSNARRASETAQIFAQQYNYPLHEISFRPELYTFDESRLEQIVRSFDNCYDSIILFGHNEAITNFVNKFGHAFTDNVPTSGFVFLQLDTDDWQQIQSGKTLKTIFPRDLK